MSERDREPIDRALRPALDEAGVARVWRKISEGRQRRPSPIGMLVGVAVLAGVAAALVVGFMPGRGSDAGPLASAGARLAPGATVAQSFALDDGSRVSLQGGATLDVLGNDGRVFVTLVRRGKASFEVKPGGPRRWIVETDLATIDVVGTGFDVDRRGRDLVVTVKHGIVTVSGERVPGRV